jgi:NADPH-dependent 2,4-dienoyl-CoA reductase/sulfur reductase-like enzyme
MAAAIEAKKAGAREVILIERAERLGGVLPQCIHTGFGVSFFGRDLTGPEFAQRQEDEVARLGVDTWLNAMVIEAYPDRTLVVSTRQGLRHLQPDALILAVGARERTRGAIAIPGDRPAGIFSAGTAQYLTNIVGLQVGREILVLGSGDIGLIMARRFTLEGLKVHAVLELMPFAGGLMRNVQQCLRDYAIPLHLSCTVVKVRGRGRVQEVVAARVDEDLNPMAGTERSYAVDTLVLSVGLLPEVELLQQVGLTILPQTGGPAVNQTYASDIPGIYVVGNGMAIWDLADNVAQSAITAGRAAVSGNPGRGEARIDPGPGVRLVVPQRWQVEPSDLSLSFRVTQPVFSARIRLKRGTDLLARKRYLALRPAEMGEWTIPADVMSKVEPGDRLTLELEERRE